MPGRVITAVCIRLGIPTVAGTVVFGAIAELMVSVSGRSNDLRAIARQDKIVKVN